MDDDSPVKYKVPTLDDIRGSGKITEIATSTWGFVRKRSGKTPQERGQSLLRILTNRFGASGDARLFFDETTLRFHSSGILRDFNKLL
jgi:replicative DNA helicase